MIKRITVGFLVVIIAVTASLSMIFAQKNDFSVIVDEKAGVPSFITFNDSSKISKDTNISDYNEDRNIVTNLYNFIDKNNNIFKLSDKASQSLRVETTKTDSDGNIIVTMQQIYKDTPVYGYKQKIIIGKSGNIKNISGLLVPSIDKYKSLNLPSNINPDEAAQIAEKDLGLEPIYEKKPAAKKIVYVSEDYSDARNAYFVELNFIDPEPGIWHYFIDCNNGKIINKYNTIGHIQQEGTGVLGDKRVFEGSYKNGKYYLEDKTRGNGIFTYDCKGGTSLPGTLFVNDSEVWTSENSKAGVDAHYFAQIVYDYYKNMFSRNSYDGEGASIKVSCHYNKNYNNAFWNGSQIVLGDGDGKVLRNLAAGFDVIAHELTHAVSSSEAGFVYRNESGALSEAYSDMFATAMEYWADLDPDWMIGEDVYTPNVEGDCLRDLADPASTKLPDHYSKRYTGYDDNGGVHYNCTIITKAAHLMSEGGTWYDVKVKAIGIEKTMKIMYRALCYYCTSSTSFKNFRVAVQKAAADIYGSTSLEMDSVNNAFDAVGIK